MEAAVNLRSACQQQRSQQSASLLSPPASPACLDVLDKWVAAMRQQQLHHRLVLVRHRLVQRRPAVRLAVHMVYVGAVLQQLQWRDEGRGWVW